ncbi:MAG: hypothetical protein ACKPKO_20190, partial [Candidatus Fonsibacter sp.]
CDIAIAIVIVSVIFIIIHHKAVLAQASVLGCAACRSSHAGRVALDVLRVGVRAEAKVKAQRVVAQEATATASGRCTSVCTPY